MSLECAERPSLSYVKASASGKQMKASCDKKRVASMAQGDNLAELRNVLKRVKGYLSIVLSGGFDGYHHHMCTGNEYNA